MAQYFINTDDVYLLNHLPVCDCKCDCGETYKFIDDNIEIIVCDTCYSNSPYFYQLNKSNLNK